MYFHLLKKGSGEDQLATIQGTGKRKIKKKKQQTFTKKKKGKK